MYLVSVKFSPLVVFVFSVNSCVTPLPKQGIPVSATYMKKLPIKVFGSKRSYLIHIPNAYKADKSMPLVIIIHGAFSTAKEMERQSGFIELADKEKFIAVYPNGAYGIFGLLQHWNAGHCCGKAASDNIDDVGFLDMVIADVAERFDIDKKRIYMVGFSNGGMLTYRFAAERSEVVAAIATVGATLGGRASEDDSIWMVPHPSRPVPLVSFHGKQDLNVPYEGGRSPLKRNTREIFSIEQSMKFWVENNKCEDTPVTENLYQGIIARDTWTAINNDNSEVILYTIEGWEHKWPGKYFTEKLRDDHPLKGFDAAEIIWQFFSNH